MSNNQPPIKPHFLALEHCLSTNRRSNAETLLIVVQGGGGGCSEGCLILSVFELPDLAWQTAVTARPS